MNKFLALVGLLIVTYVAISLIMPSDEEIRDSRVISNCWDEELKICKDENKGDACTFGVYKLCAAKHPKMQKTFESRLDACTYKNDGTAIDNPDILECAGIESDRINKYCWEKYANVEAQTECRERGY
tara:strand:+ start:156 stop:539 length:384 start_codon:yes stop_codon:yes gene_type:complete